MFEKINYISFIQHTIIQYTYNIHDKKFVKRTIVSIRLVAGIRRFELMEDFTTESRDRCRIALHALYESDDMT